jgi:hypothetical protein
VGEYGHKAISGTSGLVSSLIAAFPAYP